MFVAALARTVYRTRQFWWALRARVSSVERRDVEEKLSGAELVLFNGMDGPAQRHSFNVYDALLAGGCTDEEVLTAALLHDVGKGSPGLFYRVATVLVSSLWPAGMARLASANSRSWRYGFFTYVRHASIGAEMLARAGSSPRVVHLVNVHHLVNVDDEWLKELQMADEQN